MFIRVRNGLALGMLLAFMTSLTVFAKGGFSFIAIRGPGIDGEIRSTDLSLTNDFFAFADFYRNKAETPLDPGKGYEITRYYLDEGREDAFDQLHYYPETGFVYYDGIVNGESEYDGNWYSANPAIKTTFEDTLPGAPVAKSSSVQSQGFVDQAPSASRIIPSKFVMPVAILSGLAILLLFLIRHRKPSVQ